ncbi:MAG TPA: beta-ketoacyl synthase N-terminal-like domain-containing protein [Ktedonobacteraceae bacterium]|jgi:acyl transferase domain-containing protein/acyl carrier protein
MSIRDDLAKEQANLMVEQMTLRSRRHQDLPSSQEEKSRTRSGQADYAIKSWLVERLASYLAVSPAMIDTHEPFASYGISSRDAVEISGDLARWLGRSLSANILYDYPSIDLVTRYLLEPEQQGMQTSPNAPCPPPVSEEPIAIVGIGCRFPGGAHTPEAFWHLLREKRDVLSEVPPTRWESARFYDPDPQVPGKMYTRTGGFLADIDGFDARFFGISPREALHMDPQQRLLLEVAWEAFEHAGVAVDTLAGSSTGVFIGMVESHDYARIQEHQSDRSYVDDPYYELGTSSSIAAGRISYLFDLRGPNVTLDTACSSSLVALHLACQSLRTRECQLALAGGVNAILRPEYMVNFCKMRMLSTTGRCRTFDAEADGFIFGEGCGLVVLKRYADALAAGDTIFALIRGSALNQDGKSNGITAPSRLAQEQVVRQALQNARLLPGQISYIEAHGSGTELGDPIEIGALESVFAPDRQPEQRLLVGSVKTNLGHLAGAAGIAGLIKTVLALHYKQIPAHLNVQKLNPHLAAAFERNLALPHDLTPWQSEQEPRRAGVSSFGWSGTNVHVVLEEAPEQPAAAATRPWQCLLLSAKTEQALAARARHLAGYLREHPQIALADVSYTCNTGRSSLDYRRTLLYQTREEAIALLENAEPAQVIDAPHAGQRPVIFLFPGVGEQYPGMAWELYEHEPHFRATVEHCAELLLPQLKMDIRELLYPASTAEQARVSSKSGKLDLRAMLGRDKQPMQKDEAAERLKQTICAQPALFVIEYALAQLWISWGVQPQAMLGHSLGEYVAACVSGVLSLEDALFLVTQRARLVNNLPEGRMLAVALSEVEVQPYLEAEISLAAVNGPQSCVLAGPPDALARMESSLAERGTVYRRLPTTHAFHSIMMEPVQPALMALVSTVRLHAPQIPYISNVSGTWITEEQVTDYTYWAQHLRQTVRFADGLHEVFQQPGAILLEVGPGQSLCSFVRQQAIHEHVSGLISLSSLAQAYEQRSELATLVQSAAQMWLAGVRLDWSSFYRHEQRRHIPLPPYAFEHQRYWVSNEQPSAPGRAVPAEEKRLDMANWFYLPTWKQTPLPSRGVSQALAETWLIFADSCNVSTQLAARFQQQGADIIFVVPGTSFQRLDERTYSVAADQPDAYMALLQHLQRLRTFPRRILHTWTITPPDPSALTLQGLEASQSQGFYSLLYLVQAIGALQASAPLQLLLLSNAMQDVTGLEALRPEKALALSFCKVLAKEYPSFICRSIDIELPQQGTRLPEWLLEQLQMEVSLPDTAEELVAYRGTYRWTQTFEPLRLEAAARENVPLKSQGVYLITGGLGGLGLGLADYLARSFRARLVLVGRSAIPERAEWSAWLATRSAGDAASSKIRQILALEELGAEVLYLAADVANEQQMRIVLARAHAHFGMLQGVFHLAGVPGEGLIQLKTREKVEQVLAPKVRGTLILADLLQQEPLDFLLLYSSSIVITGGLGEIDYTAANAFLDAFSAYCQQRYTWPCQVIDWGVWRWDAWQQNLSTSPSEGKSRIQQVREQYGLDFVEGEQALARMLASPLRRVAVLKQGLAVAVEQWTKLSSLAFLVQTTPVRPGQQGHTRPNLKNPYVAPRSADEKKIAAIWQEALGIEEIGIHDHFFELGGNSLVGMMVVARLQQEFQQELSVVSLFEGPTVSTLLRLIKPQQVQPILTQNSQRGKLRKERMRALSK